MNDFKLTAFTQEDYDAYNQHWQDDNKMEEGKTADEVNLDDYTFELSPKVLPDVVLVDVKELSYEDKVRFIKFCFNCDCISNACIISNLVILAQGRLIEEELYENKDIFINDDLEFLDACSDLREEILNFNTNIVNYFLGALKSMSNFLDDGAVHIPNIYFLGLSSYNLNSISSAMQKVSLDYDKIPLVMNAEDLVERVCVQKNFVNEFMGQLLEKITAE